MRRKLCYGLLLALFTIFGLSLSVSSDANAVSQLLTYNISSIDFRNLNTYTNITGITPVANSSTSLFDLSGKMVDTNGIRYGNLTLHLPSNATFSNSRRFSIDLYFRSYDDGREYSLHQFFCPTGSTAGFFIESCDITDASVFDDINRYNTNGTIYGDYVYYYIVRIVGYYNSDNDYSTNTIPLNGKFFQAIDSTQLFNNFNVNVLLGFSTFNTFIPDETPEEQINNKDTEDRDNLESQSSDTDSAADSSSEDAESTGTTLLGAFSSFVSALTSASPSNCNLDMDLGNLDLGVVNLCQLSLPQPIPTIASILLIAFCVPLSISTARKVISLFRSFQ